MSDGGPQPSAAEREQRDHVEALEAKVRDLKDVLSADVDAPAVQARLETDIEQLTSLVERARQRNDYFAARLAGAQAAYRARALEQHEALAARQPGREDVLQEVSGTMLGLVAAGVTAVVAAPVARALSAEAALVPWAGVVAVACLLARQAFAAVLHPPRRRRRVRR